MIKENLKKYPLMAVRDMVIFPLMVMHLDVGREISKKALEAAQEKDNMIFLVTQKTLAGEEVGEEDLYLFGTIAKIRQSNTLPDGNIRIIVEGISRAEIMSVGKTDGYLTADVLEHEVHYNRNDIEIRALATRCKDLFIEYTKISGNINPEAIFGMVNISNEGQRADVIAFNSGTNVAGKQKVLECLDVRDRLFQVIYLLTEEIEVLKIDQKIDGKVRQSMEQHQQEYYLREKIKAAEEELSELTGEDEEIGRYVSKMDSMDLPDEVREKLWHELDRLKKLPMATGETGVIQSYIETVLSLPWNKSLKVKTDIKKARKILEADHYGLEKVKERVIEHLSVMKLTGKPQGSILCLYGPPGTGKTSVARSIARSMGREYVRVSLGGVRDEADIRGHRKTYIGSMPGRIVEALKKAGCDNPMILLDEIDKMGADGRGNPAAALLEVLDSEQNHAFRDHYLELPFDISKVMFITTANSLDTIDRALLDRMDIINLSGYHYEEKLNIAKKYLVAKQCEKHGVSKKQLKFTDGAIKEIIDRYTREAGVRSLERKIATICRKTAVALVELPEKTVKVDAANVKDYLGTPVYSDPSEKAAGVPGVATGLAWTAVGGETLSIEVNVLEGSGELKLTGNLGDIMKESAQAAISYIRSRAKILGLDETFHKTKDIHIHVPEGATPKDGPSAGITIATAVISALTGKVLRQRIAMTGEVTIRGRVLAIGGLKEKSLAALRCGMDMVIIPVDNKKDIEELPAAVKENISFICVENMDEVLKYAFEETVFAGKNTEKHKKIGMDVAYIPGKEDTINKYMK